MRNIFDQYSQPENRVTHALVSALNEDRSLLGSFLRKIVKEVPPTSSRSLAVEEQKIPGHPEQPEDAKERKGLPDAWIHDGNWCLLIESKVASHLTNDQLRRHESVARRLGFEHVIILAIIISNPPQKLPSSVKIVYWRDIYQWLSGCYQKHEWAKRVADFLEIAESKMSETGHLKEGTLTTFTGFLFGNDYPLNYLEGKRILGLAMNELKSRSDLKKQLDMNPKLPGRPAITGRGENRVWDFMQLSRNKRKNFTEYPHLTLGVLEDRVEAMVTVPNSVNGNIRKKFIDLEYDGFYEVIVNTLEKIEKGILKKAPGTVPWFTAVQRRYPTQRSIPFIDAHIDFDLRTAIQAQDRNNPVKHQPEWLKATYGAFMKKRSNYQIQIGVRFPYRNCSVIQSAKAIDYLAQAWIGCRPFLQAVGL